jgi:S1-C subfamily serine protease
MHLWLSAHQSDALFRAHPAYLVHGQFCFAGGADKEFPVKVERLRPGGIAEKSESLEVGDRILAINGTTTDNLTHAEAVALLRDAGDTVTLEVEYETTADGMLYILVYM